MTVTRSSHWRTRHLAIGRKGAHEVDWLFAHEEEEQADVMSPRKHHLEQTPSKPSSPISVASTFDVPAVGEIKPLVLPGSWVVVGKGGRPLKNDKMYEEPVAAKKKKKKKARSRKALRTDEEEPLLATLEEAPASSKCLHVLERSLAGRKQQLARAMEAKHWASYQRAKQLKRADLAELIAALDLDQSEEASGSVSAPATPAIPTKDNKANRMKDKARRHARSAAAAARCFSHDDDEQEWVMPLSARAVAKEARALRAAGLSGELALIGSSTTAVQLPGAWMTVGKRGKVLSDFPPLKQSDTADTRKRQGSPSAGSSGKQLKANEQPNKPADSKRGKSIKKSKCTLM